ncbi:hypothetical protein HK105_205729 [Polyrhizophydium stewartii]|uniref:LisH domain-containing protein n=1 Tax=Polyrhizophydium stewartii TaxID=2732419 RepID=A0ABR4N5J6_9FUNG
MNDLHPAAPPPARAAALSAAELRARLVDTLARSGVTDAIKSQLRAKLFSELRLRAGPVPAALPPAAAGPPASRLLRVVDSLLVGYLLARRLEFTLSVFVPEAGIGQIQKALSDADVITALHLTRPPAPMREMMQAVSRSTTEPLLVRLLDGLARIGDVQKSDKEMQTNTELEDILNIKISEIERSMGSHRHATSKSSVRAIEERLFDYQKQLELRMQEDSKEQMARFKEIELAQARIEERKIFQAELARHKADNEQRLIEMQQRHIAQQEQESKRLQEKEKEIERQNLELRQRLLDENNRAVLKEVQMRNEAELQAKQLSLERDLLQRRFEEVQAQVADLQSFKERYTQKMEESAAQYKINLNKEYSAMLSNVEIERAKIDAERMLLKEKNAAVERMHAIAIAAEEERETLKRDLKETRAQLELVSREKDDAVFQSKELQLQILTHQGSTALEFEISSLKKQLVEAERMAEKRQEEYQALLKSFMTPKDDLREELGKARAMEAKWQRECQQLVMKLDHELNRTDELQRRLDDEVLKSRELQRELADTRLLLHQAQSVYSRLSSRYVDRADHAKLADPLDLTAWPASLSSRIQGAHPERLPEAAYASGERGLLPNVVLSRSGTGNLPADASVPAKQLFTAITQAAAVEPAYEPQQLQHRSTQPSEITVPVAAPRPIQVALPSVAASTGSGQNQPPAGAVPNEPRQPLAQPVVQPLASTTTTPQPAKPSNQPDDGASTRAAAVEAARADEEAEIKRVQEMQRRREEERRRMELEERQRIQRERDELAKEAEETAARERRRLEQEREAEQRRLEQQQREAEEVQRQREKQEEEERRKAQATNKGGNLETLESDPMMQRYMALVKERREQQAKVGAHLLPRLHGSF